MANYITSLQNENTALRSALKTWEDSANAFRAFLGSAKFCGVDSDGSRKDWIAVADVANWLRDVQSAIATEIPPARPVPPSRGANLDGFADSDELRAHLSSIIREGTVPQAYLAYGCAKASAMTARSAGNLARACELERQCERIYDRDIPAAWRW